MLKTGGVDPYRLKQKIDNHKEAAPPHREKPLQTEREANIQKLKPT
jgi:hypothetical protein